MKTEDLDNLTKRFALEVADFENKHKVINGGFVTGLFRKYLIEADKEIWNAAIDAAENKWISVDERPLFTKDEKGIWTCTEDGDGEFFAAVPYNDVKRPKEELWWIRHCVVEDEIGLCVVGDDDIEPAGWDLEDVTHWMPLPKSPIESKQSILNLKK